VTAARARPPDDRREAAAVFATVAAVHAPINLVGYALGAGDTPI
jgi:hypothetical protein